MTTNTIKKMAAIAALIFGFGFASWAEQVTIGNLESASQFTSLPFNGTYNYSYSQQIYTAGEIGGAGVINTLTVWLVHTGSEALPTFNIDIYMKEVSKDAFSNTSDWVNVSSWDKVYTGTLTVANTTARAFTFTLDRSFVYSGQNNLLIAFDDNTGSWKSGLRGMVFGTAGTPARSIYALNDNTNFDPTSMSGVTAYTTSYQRNVIELGIYDEDLSNIHNITIGDPQSTSQITSLPWVGIYDYSYTQQIYTADEIGTSGTINAVTMWLVHTGSEALPTFNIDIYMKEVDKETFSGSSDWVSVSVMDKVYSGSVKVTNTSAQAFTFTLATPFAYSGQGNLLIVFDDKGVCQHLFPIEHSIDREELVQVVVPAVEWLQRLNVFKFCQSHVVGLHLERCNAFHPLIRLAGLLLLFLRRGLHMVHVVKESLCVFTEQDGCFCYLSCHNYELYDEMSMQRYELSMKNGHGRCFLVIFTYLII